MLILRKGGRRLQWPPRFSVTQCILTHALIRSLTPLFTQALWSIYLSLYKPWPGPPRHLHRWARRTQGQVSLVQWEELAVETRGGWGSSEKGLSASAWEAPPSFTEEKTLNWEGRMALCPVSVAGRVLQAGGTACAEAQELRSIWPVQERTLGLEWLEKGVCVSGMEPLVTNEAGEAGAWGPFCFLINEACGTSFPV